MDSGIVHSQNVSKNVSKNVSGGYKPIQSPEVSSTTTGTQDKHPIIWAALTRVRK
jgi:hypothetical protein